MKRKIAAALMFNVYAWTFVGAFWAATPFVFHGPELVELKSKGLPFAFDDWGFFDIHYLWRLLAASVSTFFSALICGAIAREDGGKVALVANIPSVLGWLVFVGAIFYLRENGDAKRGIAEGVLTAISVVSLIAIPVTFWLAVKGGDLGERFRMTSSPHRGNLLIADWHWAWLWIPLGAYGYRVIANLTIFVHMQISMGLNRKLSDVLVSMLGTVIVVMWTAPMALTFAVLKGRMFRDRRPLFRGTVVVATLGGGYFVALGVHHVLGSILDRFGY